MGSGCQYLNVYLHLETDIVFGDRTKFLRTNKILSEHRFRKKQKPTIDECFQQNTREIQHKYGYWIWGNT